MFIRRTNSRPDSVSGCNRRRRRICFSAATSVRSAPIDPFEQERQLRGTQQDRSTAGLGPHKVALIEPSIIQTQPLRLVPQDLQPICASNDIQHTDLKVLLLSMNGIPCTVAVCNFFGARGAEARRSSISKCRRIYRARSPRGCAIPPSVGPCRWVARKFLYPL